MKDTKEKHATHTPGPWVAMGKAVYTESDNPTREILWGGHNTRSASDEEKRANARLIAQSPAMYEMCKLLLPIMQSIADDGHLYGNAESRKGELADKLREVLAKVDGGEG